jgi:ethanolamine utilization protein EutN
MILGKVVGTVVSSIKNDSLSGARYLLVEKCNQQGVKKGDYVVALDLVGAGNDELVMVSEGSSAVIIGIIDSIEENETVVYKK